VYRVSADLSGLARPTGRSRQADPVNTYHPDHRWHSACLWSLFGYSSCSNTLGSPYGEDSVWGFEKVAQVKPERLIEIVHMRPLFNRRAEPVATATTVTAKLYIENSIQLILIRLFLGLERLY
jgi:hypothetical protein